jgi:hypothetical protein
MATTKRTPQSKTTASGGPRASRPHITDPAYGIPKSEKGLLPWSHVVERMTGSKYYWVCSVDPAHQPHATPVDGIWIDDALYFGGSSTTRRSRNLKANPAACIHLENGLEAVILHGEVKEETPDPALSTRLSQATHQKYGYGPQPEDYAKMPVQVFRPSVVFAWKQFPKDVTRWQFPNRP